MNKEFTKVSSVAMTTLALLFASAFPSQTYAAKSAHPKAPPAKVEKKQSRTSKTDKKKTSATREVPKAKAAIGKHTAARESKKAQRAAMTAQLAKSKNNRLAAKSPRSQKAGRDRLDDTAYTPASFGTPRLASQAAFVQDAATGKALLEKNANLPRPIASITKLMTAMVALDAKPLMNEALTVTEDDVDRIKHSTSRLAVGTTLPRSDMLRLALMSSENRAAHALARHYPGGIPAFVAAMNRKAQSLGLRNTRFEDPTGLSPSNVASPQDLAKMVAAASRYRAIQDASTSEEATVAVSHGERVFRNTNPLVRQGKWDIDVSKTGYIQEAGRCLVMQATIAHRPMLIVLLDAAGKDTRIQDAKNIKRWIETKQIASLTTVSES